MKLHLLSVRIRSLLYFEPIADQRIDYKTDTIIQKSLRTELKRDVTVLTVAHRLRTVLDADKIVGFFD
jgi:ABC-type transport system involved in Fe-S cluster assembly fused permease/ATPase subunit